VKLPLTKLHSNTLNIDTTHAPFKTTLKNLQQESDMMYLHDDYFDIHDTCDFSQTNGTHRLITSNDITKHKTPS
jgi:hypothetical protein